MKVAVGGHPKITAEDIEEEKQRRKQWLTIKKNVSPLAMKQRGLDLGGRNFANSIKMDHGALVQGIGAGLVAARTLDAGAMHTTKHATLKGSLRGSGSLLRSDSNYSGSPFKDSSARRFSGMKSPGAETTILPALSGKRDLAN